MAELTAEQKKYRQMTEEPVSRVIPRLALPGIVSMLVTSIYNMADTYFVSQLSRSASGAVGVVLSLMTLIQAIGFMLGMGAGVMLAQMLGRRDEETAGRYLSVSFFTAVAIGLAIMTAGLSIPERLALWLGSTDTILPYATDYMRYILIGAPYMCAAFAMNGLLRFQGNSFFSMLGIGFGGVLNMFLDPVFIYGLDLGIAGAAIATLISQFISFCILLYFCARRNAVVRLRARNFRPSLEVYRNIFRMGLPSLARQSVGGFATIVLNRCAHPFGDAAIAAMGIVNRVTMFLNSALIGYGQGFQPVCSYCYGAKKFSRIREGFFFCIKTASGFLAALALLVFFRADAIVEIFRRGDAEVIAIGAAALRYESLMVPLCGFYIMNNMLTQTTGRSARATILACARQGIFFIPTVIVLTRTIGLAGLQLSQPISELLSAAMAFVFCRITLRELDAEERAARAAEEPS